ncbi:DUF6415 family natural product biosynthesis protein [Streptomyces sp. OZ13]|uniref:DUF6415 family natural product biosynthesis protein n=1 Tax=Streptomyces sp. OZ13 TaxID=3452210 RepID=UPI003F8CC136
MNESFQDRARVGLRPVGVPERCNPQRPSESLRRLHRPWRATSRRRAAAARVCTEQGAGAPQEDVGELAGEMRGYIRRLVPDARASARRRASGDVLPVIASTGADEAERLLSARPGFRPDA